MTNKSARVENLDPNLKAIENNSCGVCRGMGLPLPCKGHARSGGGSGGGKGDDGSNRESKNKNPGYIPKPKPEFEKIEYIAKDWDLLLTLSERIIDFKAGLLAIESDMLRGILTFRGKAGLSKEELEILREYLNTIKTEFDAFKIMLAERGMSVKDFTAVIKDDVLTINIPNPKLYADFIFELTNKNLLPSPHAEKQAANRQFITEQNSVLVDSKNVFNPTPFETRPKPKGWKE